MNKRKYIILIGDGMGDYPQAGLGDKTVLQSAFIPNMRSIAALGEARLVKTVPEGMPAGSDVANLSIMGFNPAKYYTGRAPIEAAGAGIDLKSDDVAFRCNLITVANGLIADHSAGHISTEDALPLIAMVEKSLGGDGRRFFPGASYRHLLVWNKGPHDALVTTPPHDVLCQPVEKNLPRGPRAAELVKLMDESKKIFAACGKKAGAATQIWLWGQGRATALPSFRELFGLSGGVVTAVDLVRGIGRLAGLEARKIKGATGFVDTDYAGKVKAAFALLEKHDFVFVHVEAPDECGHNGDLRMKVKAVEDFDRFVVGPVWEALNRSGWRYRLIVGTDHRTPVNVRNHTCEPVPMAVVNGPVASLKCQGGAFDEFINKGRSSGMAYEWLQTLLTDKSA